MLFECAITPGDRGTNTQKSTLEMVLVEKSIRILRNSEMDGSLFAATSKKLLKIV
jgi:hypothetical protein